MNVSLSTLSSSTKVVCNKEDVVLLKDGNEEIKNKFMDIFAFEGFSSNVLTLRKAEEGEIISYEKQEQQNLPSTYSYLQLVQHT